MDEIKKDCDTCKYEGKDFRYEEPLVGDLMKRQVNDMDKPKKLDEWFYMVMKEIRRNDYMDLIECWDITEEESTEVIKYIEEKLGVRL
jgi:hypothetical protein